MFAGILVRREETRNRAFILALARGSSMIDNARARQRSHGGLASASGICTCNVSIRCRVRSRRNSHNNIEQLPASGMYNRNQVPASGKYNGNQVQAAGKDVGLACVHGLLRRVVCNSISRPQQYREQHEQVPTSGKYNIEQVPASGKHNIE